MVESIKLFDVLQVIRPGASWALDGNDYSGLQWLDENQEKPTEEECLVALSNMQVTFANNAVREAREQAYRLNSDPLFFKWQRGSIEKQVWLDEIQRIKDENPYPQRG